MEVTLLKKTAVTTELVLSYDGDSINVEVDNSNNVIFTTNGAEFLEELKTLGFLKVTQMFNSPYYAIPSHYLLTDSQKVNISLEAVQPLQNDLFKLNQMQAEINLNWYLAYSFDNNEIIINQVRGNQFEKVVFSGIQAEVKKYITDRINNLK